MNREDVARLAAAIAKANSHPDPADWAVKVLKEWDGADEPSPPESEEE